MQTATAKIVGVDGSQVQLRQRGNSVYMQSGRKDWQLVSISHTEDLAYDDFTQRFDNACKALTAGVAK